MDDNISSSSLSVCQAKGDEEKGEERRWTHGEKLKDEAVEVEAVINASNVQGNLSFMELL